METNQGNEHKKETNLNSDPLTPPGVEPISTPKENSHPQAQAENPPNEPQYSPSAVTMTSENRADKPMSLFESQYLCATRDTLRVSKSLRSLQFWTLIAALSAAVFVGFQYREMKNQTIISAAAFQKSIVDSINSDATIKRQLEIADTQAKTIAKQLEVSERPWIAVSAVSAGTLRLSREGNVIADVRYSIKNTGRSPAIGVLVGFKMLINEPQANLPKKQRETCGEYPKQLAWEKVHKIPRESPILRGDIVFPGDFIQETITSMGEEDGNFTPASEFISVSFVGCVYYQFAFSPLYRQTGFIYDLVEIDPSLSPNPIYKINMNHGEIPYSKLRLLLHWPVGFSAN